MVKNNILESLIRELDYTSELRNVDYIKARLKTINDILKGNQVSEVMLNFFDLNLFYSIIRQEEII